MYKMTCDLKNKEMEELRDGLYQTLLDNGEIDIDNFDCVADEQIHEHYDGIMFTEEDFFCNLNYDDEEI